MSSHPSIKSIVSSSRIMFGLLPGLGALIVIRMAIHLYRPDIEDSENRVHDRNIEDMYDCYDFIIVGGGSAGAVLANRLSENPNWNILLLEAGPDENVLSEVPILFPTLQTSAIDWQFVTERSDQYCVNMVDRRCKWPRGKVLGGSSVLNAMLYIRGNRRDYDNWENMGNPGWGYEDVLPYFIKSEDIRILEHFNDPYHGTGGPLTVEYFSFEHPITSKILEAATQLGYDIRDVNGEFQTGFTRSQATVRDGLRCSTAKAFLRPVSQRQNLHISLHSLVEKVLIDENNTAYGVKFVKHGQHKIIKASKEVILSAGSIQSPQLLMLSGIGDAQHLKEVGIHPIVNSPGVGRNLQDHVAMGGHSFLFDNPYKNESDYCFNLNTVFTIGSLMDFSLHKNGVMYSMIEAEAMAFVNTKYQDPDEDYPDVQLFIAPTADNMDGGLFGKRANGLTDETYAELYEDILYESSFSVVPLLLRPKSRGYIKLRDSNPYSSPLIYPNYFTEPDDVKVLIEGARIAQALVEQPALKSLNARPNSRRNPGCANHELMSDEHLECQARHHTLTIYHPVGTCAMGPDDDPGAVVDSRLRVYGIKNLRVVDGSVMPTIVSGNTNAPIIMIAEKASDIIKEDWLNTPELLGAVCSIQNKLKNSESENPTIIALITKRLDVFNETANLFPVLSNNMKFDETKSRINNENEQPVHNAVDKTMTSLKTVPTANSFANDVNKPLIDIIPSYSKPYPDIYGYIPPLLPPPPPLPYFPIRPDDVYYNYNTYNQNPIHKSITTYPYNEPIDINTFKLNSKLKQRKNKFTKKLPVFPNWNNRFSFINYIPSNKQIPYYETKEEVSPNGQRKCRIWLYYNGVKYEVIL